ncbi:MAG: hypothetical protein HY657_16190 [Acidobacteria bacterium]|nr:hypothetical protein [Acidobacteriota bacterium]
MASLLRDEGGMGTHTATRHHPARRHAAPTLRWVFRRGAETLTCEVDATGSRWEVCVVPHWDVAATVIERFKTPISALERHAEIAHALREVGWTLVDRAPVGSPQRPHPQPLAA